MNVVILLMLMSIGANSQTEGTQLSVGASSVGGSYYDVPMGWKLDKYGPERLSPEGVALIAKMESDSFGNLYLRKLAIERGDADQTLGKWDWRTFLGSQLMFLYESPKISLNKNKKENVDLFLKGNLSHFGQNDHFMYFKVDGEFTPELDTQLEKQPHARVARKQTFLAPEIGVCYDLEKNWGNFNVTGFAQASIAPLALLDYQTKVTENKIDTVSLDKLQKEGATFGFGGEIQIAGVAKYKEKYYFKLKFIQSAQQSLNSAKVSGLNRITQYELGYLINKNFSVNLNVENNELILTDQNRRSIEVYNNVGLGLKYFIPKMKKSIKQ